MTHTLDDDARALGLAGAIAGQHLAIPVPDRGVGEGLVERPAVSLRSLLSDGLEHASFLHVRLRALEELGLVLHAHEQNQRVVKVSSTEGDVLELAGRPVASERDPEDPGTVLLELGAERVAVVAAGRRCGVMLEAHARALTQVFLPLPEEAFEPLQSPARRWAPSDPWLARKVKLLVAGGDPIGHAIAMGLLKRLQAPSGTAASVVEAMLRGEPTEELRRCHAWMRSLQGAQQRGIERLACERARRLLESLQKADAATLAWCVERDELEGVRLLLLEIGAGQRLDRVVQQADRAGLRLPPLPGCATDEQMARARRLDPAAWWTRSEDA